MARIMIILEDFNEMTFMESALKKVGFDTMGLLNETNLPDKMMIFNPSVVLSRGRGNRLSGLGVAKKVREMKKSEAKVALIFAPDAKPQPQELMGIRLDVILETPLNLARTVEVLARLCNIDAAPMLEKLNKIKGSLGSAPAGWSSQTQEAQPTSGVIPLGKKKPAVNKEDSAPAKQTSSVPQSDVERSIASVDPLEQTPEQIQIRKERMKEILAETEPLDAKATTFSRRELKKRMRDMKQDWDPQTLADLDQQRKEFAEAM
ncbi:MAG: hypothetical protein AB7H97_16655, partial [Pseudobdellovibrionaceae bacterium]